MTLYELAHLEAYTGEQIVGLLSVYLALASAAIVGAYVAGNKLTRVLAWGIAFLYTIPALSLTRVRYLHGHRLDALTQDILATAQRENSELQILSLLENGFVLGHETAMIAYVSIWAAVIFFVFYAKSRVKGDARF